MKPRRPQNYHYQYLQSFLCMVVLKAMYVTLYAAHVVLNSHSECAIKTSYGFTKTPLPAPAENFTPNMQYIMRPSGCLVVVLVQLMIFHLFSSKFLTFKHFFVFSFFF